MGGGISERERRSSVDVRLILSAVRRQARCSDVEFGPTRLMRETLSRELGHDRLRIEYRCMYYVRGRTARKALGSWNIDMYRHIYIFIRMQRNAPPQCAGTRVIIT